jgi:hypothetical protein
MVAVATVVLLWVALYPMADPIPVYLTLPFREGLG